MDLQGGASGVAQVSGRTASSRRKGEVLRVPVAGGSLPLPAQVAFFHHGAQVAHAKGHFLYFKRGNLGKTSSNHQSGDSNLYSPLLYSNTSYHKTHPVLH